MLVVLSGAILNAGDFLITKRARALLERFSGGEELHQLPANLALEDHRETLRNARAVVILGGPGCRPNVYPHVYPLLKPLESLRIPIHLMGTGWKGAHASPEIFANYRFDPESQKFLKRCASTRTGIGVRDIHTWEVLRRNGFNDVRITGCPAWYDDSHLGEPFSPPSGLAKITFSPPVSSLLYPQVRSLVDGLMKTFPSLRISALFHHGFEFRGSSGSPEMFAFQRKLREDFTALSIPCIDLSGTADFSPYDDCDLHVGYRVHAHIYRLSTRRASFLISEDGRGEGVDDTLGLAKFLAFSSPSKAQRRTWSFRSRQGQGRTIAQPNANLVDQICRAIQRECHHGFPSFFGFPSIIDRYFDHMEAFLRGLFHDPSNSSGHGHSAD